MVNIGLAVIALAMGGVGAWFVGRKVAMTAMPQMVAIYNGMGGGAAGGVRSCCGRRPGCIRSIVDRTEGDGLVR